MPAPITLLPLDEQLQAELQQRYEEAEDAETRIRYQMIVLAQLGHTTPRIAGMVLRSEDTVARVLKRFLTGGWMRFLGGAHQAGSAPSHRPGRANCFVSLNWILMR